MVVQWWCSGDKDATVVSTDGGVGANTMMMILMVLLSNHS